MSGLDLAHTKKRDLLGRDRPNPAHLVLYIIYYTVFVLFIYIDILKKINFFNILYCFVLFIYIDILKKLIFFEKSLKNLLIFLHIFIKIV